MIPAFLKAFATIFSNVANVSQQRKNNAAQERLVRIQNAAASRESSKAYEISTPVNQVREMQQAGMSKAGALNAINGGGSYNPAPVNVASPQAPQVDLSNMFDGLIQVGENAKQRKAAEDLQAKQIAAAEEAQRKQIESQERQQKAQLESNERIAQLNADTTNRNADNRLAWEKESYDRLPEYDKERYDLSVELLRNQKDLESNRVKDLEYRILEYQSKPNRDARDGAILLQTMEQELDYKVTQKDWNDFRNTYMYYDYDSNEWKYKKATESKVGDWLYYTAPRFWDLAARVLPADKLGQIIQRILK